MAAAPETSDYGTVKQVASYPPFGDAQLEGICRTLGDTSGGLTGAEINRFLRACGIEDRTPGLSKWRRLYAAFTHDQEVYKSANHVLDFVLRAMSPARWAGKSEHFERLRRELNVPLALAGMQLGEDGRIAMVQASTTLNEAETRARDLAKELARRGTHAEVLRFCRAELVEDANYFHAVLEASKSVAQRIRDLTGLQSDGNTLVEEALGFKPPGQPRLAFNSLRTPSEQSEHEGLKQLFRGLFSVYRNPTAHTPKIDLRIDERDALDLLSLASYLQRRLDVAASSTT
jgi:uncharacterized protein (TIGR02391 family)